MALGFCIYCRRAFEVRRRGPHGCQEEREALDAQDREDGMTADEIPTLRYGDDASPGPTALAVALRRAGAAVPADDAPASPRPTGLDRRARRLSRRYGWWK